HNRCFVRHRCDDLLCASGRVVAVGACALRDRCRLVTNIWVELSVRYVVRPTIAGDDVRASIASGGAPCSSSNVVASIKITAIVTRKKKPIAPARSGCVTGIGTAGLDILRLPVAE